MGLNFRPLVTADREILRQATLANMNWQGTQRFTFKDMDQAKELRHYYDLAPERGDFGFIAEVDGLSVGVVWVLFLSTAGGGYGYVADGVPELSICVWLGYRGQGVGAKLMNVVIDESRSRGIERISLSVEAGNPAASLYEQHGFVAVPDLAAGTFVLEV